MTVVSKALKQTAPSTEPVVKCRDCGVPLPSTWPRCSTIKYCASCLVETLAEARKKASEARQIAEACREQATRLNELKLNEPLRSRTQQLAFRTLSIPEKLIAAHSQTHILIVNASDQSK